MKVIFSELFNHLLVLLIEFQTELVVKSFDFTSLQSFSSLLARICLEIFLSILLVCSSLAQKVEFEERRGCLLCHHFLETITRELWFWTPHEAIRAKCPFFQVHELTAGLVFERSKFRLKV